MISASALSQRTTYELEQLVVEGVAWYWDQLQPIDLDPALFADHFCHAAICAAKTLDALDRDVNATSLGEVLGARGLNIGELFNDPVFLPATASVVSAALAAYVILEWRVNALEARRHIIDALECANPRRLVIDHLLRAVEVLEAA